MTDIRTVDRNLPDFVKDGWEIDIDNFSYDDFFITTQMATIKINDEEKEVERHIYDYNAYYAAERLRLAKEKMLHRERLTAAFEKRGIVSASVDFSGGNDSGGVDGITFYDADGNTMDVESRFHSSHNYVDGQYVQTELTAEQVEDNNFLNLVEAPVSWKWGSWAGDFSASGTLKYDLSGALDGYYIMEYEESSYEYHTEEG